MPVVPLRPTRLACLNRAQTLDAFLKKGHRYLGPQWVNLYGATLSSNPSDMAGTMGKAMGVADATKWVEKYNTHPNQASTYRGRVLISQRIVDEVKGARLPCTCVVPSPLQRSSVRHNFPCRPWPAQCILSRMHGFTTGGSLFSVILVATRCPSERKGSRRTKRCRRLSAAKYNGCAPPRNRPAEHTCSASLSWPVSVAADDDACAGDLCGPLH